MNYTKQLVLIAGALCAVLASSSLHAATIMKLHLDGSSGANFSFNGSVLSALSDGSAATSGDRDATIEFTNGLSMASSSFASGPGASFSLAGINVAVPSTTFNGTLVVQDFSLGNLAIYDEEDDLLLSASLTLSALTGSVGPPSASGLFLAFGNITGGSMAAELDSSSLRVKVKLPIVSGGFSVSPSPSSPPPPTHSAALDEFMAITTTIEIQAEPSVVPEPISVGMLLIGAGALVALRRAQR